MQRELRRVRVAGARGRGLRSAEERHVPAPLAPHPLQRAVVLECAFVRECGFVCSGVSAVLMSVFFLVLVLVFCFVLLCHA